MCRRGEAQAPRPAQGPVGPQPLRPHARRDPHTRVWQHTLKTQRCTHTYTRALTQMCTIDPTPACVRAPACPEGCACPNKPPAVPLRLALGGRTGTGEESFQALRSPGCKIAPSRSVRLTLRGPLPLLRRDRAVEMGPRPQGRVGPKDRSSPAVRRDRARQASGTWVTGRLPSRLGGGPELTREEGLTRAPRSRPRC